jgi:hypothetical protein
MLLQKTPAQPHMALHSQPLPNTALHRQHKVLPTRTMLRALLQPQRAEPGFDRCRTPPQPFRPPGLH